MQLILFDYSQLPQDQADLIRGHAKEINVLVRRSAQDIHDIGTRLIAVKAMLAHGKFSDWLNKEFGWNARTAQRFMAVATRFKSDNLSDLPKSTSAIYALTAAPDEVVHQIVAKVKKGDPVNEQTVKAAIAEYAQSCKTCVHLDQGPDSCSCRSRAFDVDLQVEDPGRDGCTHYKGLARVNVENQIPSLQDLMNLYAQIAEVVEHQPTHKYRNQFSVTRLSPPTLSLRFPGRIEAWRWWLAKGSILLERHALSTKMKTAGYPLAGTQQALAASGNQEIKSGDLVTGLTQEGEPLTGTVGRIGHTQIEIEGERKRIAINTASKIVNPSHQGLSSGGTDEHYTPEYLWRAAQQFWGGCIDLDPCSNSSDSPNVEAEQHYTIESNGLNQDWYGRIWCNPPYSDTWSWVVKGIEELKRDNAWSLIYLVKNDNRTSWYKLALDAAFSICVVQGYVKFGNATNSAPFGSILIAIEKPEDPRTRYEKFKNSFGSIGWVFPLFENRLTEEK